MFFPTNTEEFPKEEFFAILFRKELQLPDSVSYYIELPSEVAWEVKVYETEDEWKKQVLEFHERMVPFKAFKMSPAKIVTEVQID